MHPELISLLAAARSDELRRAAQSHDLARAARRPSRPDASLPLADRSSPARRPSRPAPSLPLAHSLRSPRRHRLPSLLRSVRLLRRRIPAVRGLWS